MPCHHPSSLLRFVPPLPANRLPACAHGLQKSDVTPCLFFPGRHPSPLTPHPPTPPTPTHPHTYTHTPVYLPNLAAFLKAAANANSTTREEWGHTCAQMHAWQGWEHFLWDEEAATRLVSKARGPMLRVRAERCSAQAVQASCLLACQVLQGARQLRAEFALLSASGTLLRPFNLLPAPHQLTQPHFACAVLSSLPGNVAVGAERGAAGRHAEVLSDALDRRHVHGPGCRVLAAGGRNTAGRRHCAAGELAAAGRLRLDRRLCCIGAA